MAHEFQTDIDAIQAMDSVPTILEVVCRTTGMGFAAVARVTEDRWIACRVLDNIHFGLAPGGELAIETTICNEIRQSHELVAIDHVDADEAFCGHHTPAKYGFQSYVSVPIILWDGTFFGTLCAIDPKPARLKNPETIGMFKLFAELIAAHLRISHDLESARARLVEERKFAEVREQFIAVLGHDLRNPLAAIDAGTNVLLRGEMDGKSKEVVSLIRGSVARMRGLIDDVVDFARVRLGGWLTLDIDGSTTMLPVLQQVVGELRAAQPGRLVEMDFSVPLPVRGDPGRIAQLVSNLLANALVHGEQGAPVQIGARTEGQVFTLWVANRGEPIAAATLKELFRPFFRGKARPSQNGFGLGLYIASEIAHAHGGTLTASSDPEETRFTFRMPLA